MSHAGGQASRNGPLIAVCAIAALCAASWCSRLAVDDLGYVDDGGTVVEIDAGGAADRAGLHLGDEIVPDADAEPGDGERVELAAKWRLSRAMRAGSVRVAIRRAGHAHVLVVVPEGATLAASIRNLKHDLPNVPTGMTFIGVALLLARRPRRDTPARAWLAIGLALCGTYFFIGCTASSPRWSLVAFACSNPLSVIGYTLVAQAVWALDGPPRSGRAVLRIAAAIGIGSALAMALDMFAVTPPTTPSNLVIFVGHAFQCLVIVAGLAYQWRTAHELVARREARLIFVLVSIGILAPLLGVSAPYTFAGVYAAGFDDVLWQAFVLVPIGLAAAAGRRGLVELDGALATVVLHATVVGLALLVYIGLSNLASALLSGPTATDAARWVGVFAVIVIAEPLRVVIKRALDHLFARDRMVLVANCARLCTELARIQETPAIELAAGNMLDSRHARLCRLDELLPECELGEPLVRRGSLRASELDLDAQRALRAQGFDTLVRVPAEPADWVLALALPLAPRSWDPAERQAVASVGHVIGSTIRQRAARAQLEARVARGEAERQAIAMELHDGVGATLTAARLITQMARRTNGGAAASALEGLEESLRIGLHDLRATLWSLDQRQLSWGDLVSRLRRQLAEVCSPAGIALAIESALPEDETGGPAAGLAVFRIVQEAFTNTLKHARARHIRCRLASKDGVQLVFEDDGVGIPEPMPMTGRGLGNMSRRVQALGGTIAFSRRAGGGTRIEVWLPLPAPHDHAVEAGGASPDPR